MTNTEKHMQICQELNELHARKDKDYGNSFSKTYDEYGLTMCAIRLEDKLQRFKRLIKNQAEVKDESIEDTLIDLANYAIMSLIEIRNDKTSEFTSL